MLGQSITFTLSFFSKAMVIIMLEYEASFWDDSHVDQFDAVCGVWSEHWQADPPPL